MEDTLKFEALLEIPFVLHKFFYAKVMQ